MKCKKFRETLQTKKEQVGYNVGEDGGMQIEEVEINYT